MNSPRRNQLLVRVPIFFVLVRTGFVVAQLTVYEQNGEKYNVVVRDGR